MNTASRAMRLPLRASRQQPWTRPQYQPTFCAHVARFHGRSRQCQLPHSFSAFSTHAIRMEKAKSQAEADSGLGSKPAWTPVAMSFESLGIGKNMKNLVLLIASVTAALELFIWCESIWNWWKAEEGDRVE